LLLYPFDIFKTELVLNNFHVAQGIDVALHMYNFRVVESANDLEYAIDSAHMRKERVSETSTCRSALYPIRVRLSRVTSYEIAYSSEASNIYARQVGRDARSGLVKLA
jgi:hypothetical protein